MQPRLLESPPIKEAVFEIKVESKPEMSLGDLEGFKAAVKDEYPDSETKIDLQGKITVEKGAIPESLKLTQRKDGIIFRSQNGDKVAQARLDGFAFSLVNNYQDWQTFFGKAFRLWEVYRSTTKPVKIERLALRFINSLDIPSVGAEESINLDEYITVLPSMGDNLNGPIQESLLRILFEDQDFSPSKGILTEIVRGTGNTDSFGLNVILDIDVYQTVSFLPEEDEAISSVFQENLRKFKNKVFFGALTRKALDGLGARYE